jgi:hypothetical protein
MPEGFWKRLLHRWFVEYNPLYLLSAAFVLAGTNLLSRGFAEGDGPFRMLGSALVAEVYAWSLIAGAALLVRIRLRRPAVMLALLAALYMGDPTLHLETCVYLGWMGALGALAWVTSFVLKLRVLAWAMEVRVSRSTHVLTSIVAAGFALVPRAFLVLSEQASTELVGLWAFGSFAAVLWTERKLESRRDLGEWGRTVLRRTRLAIWTLWGALAVVHFYAWGRYESVQLGVLLPVAALCLVRFLPGERVAHAAVGATLAAVAMAAPGQFAVTATMGAGALLLRAFREPRLEFAAVAMPTMPYRAASTELRSHVPPTLRFVRAESASLVRFCAAAFACLYLAIWSYGWSYGPWPQHLLLLDGAFAIVMLTLAWRWRSAYAGTPVAITGAHLVLERRIIPAPSSLLEWGAVLVGGGFVLLAASLSFAWLARGWRCQPAVGGEPDG